MFPKLTSLIASMSEANHDDNSTVNDPSTQQLKNCYIAHRKPGTMSISVTGCTPHSQSPRATLSWKGILLDSREQPNFIKRSSALAFGFKIYKAAPPVPAVAIVSDHGLSQHDEYVVITLTLSGPLECNIMTWVDDSDDPLQLLIGQQGLKQFSLNMHAAHNFTGVPCAVKTVRANASAQIARSK